MIVPNPDLVNYIRWVLQPLDFPCTFRPSCETIKVSLLVRKGWTRFVALRSTGALGKITSAELSILLLNTSSPICRDLTAHLLARKLQATPHVLDSFPQTYVATSPLSLPCPIWELSAHVGHHTSHTTIMPQAWQTRTGLGSLDEYCEKQAVHMVRCVRHKACFANESRVLKLK